MSSMTNKALPSHAGFMFQPVRRYIWAHNIGQFYRGAIAVGVSFCKSDTIFRLVIRAVTCEKNGPHDIAEDSDLLWRHYLPIYLGPAG